MAPYVYDNSTIRAALKLPDDKRRSLVTQMAVSQGLTAALTTGVVWGGVMGLAAYSGKFNQFKLNWSARTLIWVTPPVLAFSFVSDQTASRLARPESFAYALAEKKASALPPHKRFANYMIDHPYKIMAAVGVGGVGAIFYQTRNNPDLTFSQRVMHTRVLAQFTVLSTLASLMAFNSYMVSRGRFLEPHEEAELAVRQLEEENASKSKHIAH